MLSCSAGAQTLLRALATLTAMEELDMRCCQRSPEAAWVELRRAPWIALKAANFYGCFYYLSGGAQARPCALATSAAMGYLDMEYCDKVPETACAMSPPRYEKVRFRNMFWT